MDTVFLLVKYMLVVLLFVPKNFTVSGATQPGFLINTPNSGRRDVYSNPTDLYLYNEDLAGYGVSTTSAWDLVFEVKACGDSFILLSETADLTGNVIFELDIGCYGNSRFCISKKGHGQQTFSGGQVLDCNTFRFFWLKWTVNGDVSFWMGDTVGTNQIFLRSTGQLVGGLGVRSGFGNTAVWRLAISATTTEELTTDISTTSTSTIIPSTKTTHLPTTSGSTQSLSMSVSYCACPCSTSSNATRNSQTADDSEPGPYKVDKTTLSSQKRKLTSASDPRKSSMYIGSVGVALISFFILFIVILDCVPIVRRN